MTEQNDVQLTSTEQQVLGYVARGLVNEEIADILNISTNTVKAHLHEIFKKLSARNRAQAVILALTQQQLNLSDIFTPDELADTWASLDQDTIDKVAELVKRKRESYSSAE